MHRHPTGDGAGAISRRSRAALSERLAKTKVGDPRAKDTRMGALVSISQRDDVRGRIRELEAAGARIVSGDPDADRR